MEIFKFFRPKTFFFADETYATGRACVLDVCPKQLFVYLLENLGKDVWDVRFPWFVSFHEILKEEWHRAFLRKKENTFRNLSWQKSTTFLPPCPSKTTKNPSSLSISAGSRAIQPKIYFSEKEPNATIYHLPCIFYVGDSFQHNTRIGSQRDVLYTGLFCIVAMIFLPFEKFCEPFFFLIYI